MDIKAIIFDWGRTLFDSETKKEFSGAEKVLSFCRDQGYKLAVASLVSIHANATLEERQNQIESSYLRSFFDMIAVTDEDKDRILDSIVEKLALPRENILIVDDRVIRGIKYGNSHGHPTVWVKNGKFSNELPNEETGQPSFVITSIDQLIGLL